MAKTKDPASGNPSGDSAPLLIEILSDSTGELALHQIHTMLTQFPPGAFRVRLRNFLGDEAKWETALAEVEPGASLVIHTTNKPGLKERTRRVCAEKGLAEFDLTGPLMDFLAKNSGHRPDPLRRVHELDDFYFQRIQAMEFTLTHDDGVELRSLGEADLVLIGVSRTSKTPISLFLANKGFKVANVSIALEAGIPKALEEFRGERVVGLTVSPSRLQAIRETREKVDGIPPGTYSNRDYIQKELRLVHELCLRRKWPELNVTFSSIEESAWHVLELLRLSPYGVQGPSGTAGAARKS